MSVIVSHCLNVRVIDRKHQQTVTIEAIVRLISGLTARTIEIKRSSISSSAIASWTLSTGRREAQAKRQYEMDELVCG